MKKILILIVVLILGFFGWKYLKTPGTNSTPEVKVTPTSTHPDPSNATFEFEDGPVTLKKGSAETQVIPGSAITDNTTLTNDLAYGDLNGDDKNDTALLLVKDSGGSGVFVYIAAYLSGTVMYKGSNAVFIGDRVTPKTISISNGVIKLTYLDRNAGEPLAAEPTVLTNRTFVVRAGTLEEK
ncbi:hypothetical protein KW790_02290 [Candidatus Parcubacteria bacterium]|nr:hypothetical protein [Candidatus Parcubacteria bacterium]